MPKVCVAERMRGMAFLPALSPPAHCRRTTSGSNGAVKSVNAAVSISCRSNSRAVLKADWTIDYLNKCIGRCRRACFIPRNR